MATTPPLRIAENTPPTPLHGAKYDYYRRQSTGKSTRSPPLRSQRGIETPPPHTGDLSASLAPTKPNILRSSAHTYSPPPSTHTSPRKKVGKGRTMLHSNDTSVMNAEGSSSHAASLDAINEPDKIPSLQHPSLNTAANMLPTPAKTPRKKPVRPAAVNAAARVLFPPRSDTLEDAMPTLRKRRNGRHIGFSMYSSNDDDGDASSETQIQIYTDSKDKVPELDPSKDNPFYEQPHQTVVPPEPRKSSASKKRKADRRVDGDIEIREAFTREEGLVYVFRGKKVYRKFRDDKSDPIRTDDIADSELESPGFRPLTRSSIKPRLLFPTQKQLRERTVSTVEDEEAPTDIEDPNDHEMTDPEGQQPISTPVKPSAFSPSTPPATRSATKRGALDSSPLDPPDPVVAVQYGRKGKKVSPFDGWARTKAGSGGAEGKGKKREAEAMAIGGSKKIKGNPLL